MNHTPLEDQVHEALHRTADPLERAPFTVGDVRTRARRLQRRRAAVAGAAVATLAAVAVPIGLGVVGPTQRSEVPPATQPPAPQVTGTVLVDPRSAEAVGSTSVPLVDVDAPSLITPDGAVTLPKAYETITPFRDGWVGVAMDEGSGTIELLGSDGELEGGGLPTGGLVVSPDGTRVAWSEHDGTRRRVVTAEVDGDTEWTYLELPPSPQGHEVEPIGFVSDEQVVATQRSGTGIVSSFIADGETPVALRGPITTRSASPVTGVVAAVTSSDVDGSCSAVVDGRAPTGDRVWETCDHTLGAFSPDGRHVVGLASYLDGNGSPTLAILDATTGEPVVDFEVVVPRRQVGGFDTRMAWEDDDALVVRGFTGQDTFIARLGTDGSVRRVDITSAGASGLAVAEVR